ncbi:MAG: 2-hydroxychromene-2-carboxylate isomerase [Rhodocyclaceae bacterium]
MAPIDFYFDFSSPYGYLASELIDDLAARHDRPVVWHPILLGVAFKATGAAPLPQIPLKGDYALRDFARSARFLGIPYSHPSNFPVPTQHAARTFLWLQDRDPDQARAFAHAAYRACFTANVNIAELDRVLEIAADVGANRHELGQALAEAALKERLKAEVELAMARGVFGSPFFIVEGEPFWGVDRLPHLEKWLASGGF